MFRNDKMNKTRNIINKTMKRKICLLLALTFVFAGILQFTVTADDISLYYNNTATTATAFVILDDGLAIVNVNYSGYSDLATGATIDITIEKRSFLFFWNDVVTDTITVNSADYTNEFYYQLESGGTYRCTVVYTISGTGGADDVITFEDTDSY